MSDLTTPPSELKRALTPLHLWAIGVGLVISGEYFGWNYGWGVAGPAAFSSRRSSSRVLYVTLVFSLTELATSIPRAGGPFAYSYRALGPVGGLIAGYAAAIEFLLATPAIAAALGAYLHFLHPSLPVLGSAIAVYAILTGVNLLGIQESAWLSLVITLLAIVELLVYMALVAPSFETATFVQYAMPYGWHGVLAALPFAMWLYVCIEGLAVSPKRRRTRPAPCRAAISRRFSPWCCSPSASSSSPPAWAIRGGWRRSTIRCSRRSARCSGTTTA